MIDRKRLISWLLLIASLCLIYSWPLQVAFGEKIGYWVFGVISAVIFLLTIDARWPPILSGYCLIIAFAVLMQMAFVSLSMQQAFLPLATYLFVPMIYGRTFMQEDQLRWLLKSLLIIVPINFLGILLQFSGYVDNLLQVDMTETLGIVHERYTSFVGGSLMLGYVSMLNSIVALYYLVFSEKKIQRILFGLLFLLASITLFYSFSRRFYLLWIVAVLLIPTYRYGWRSMFSAFLAGGVLILSVVMAGNLFRNVSNSDHISISDRILSTFVIHDGSGNDIRMMKNLQSLNLTISNPLLGMGVGSVGTIGKTREELIDNFEDAVIAETYYLHIGVDFGIIVATLFTVMMVYLAFISIKKFKYSGRLSALIVLLYPIESFVGAALYGVFPAFIFWISICVLLSDTYFKFYYQIRCNKAILN